MPKSLHNARLKRGLHRFPLRTSVMLGVCELLCIHMNGSLAQLHAWNVAHKSMFCCLSEIPVLSSALPLTYLPSFPLYWLLSIYTFSSLTFLKYEGYFLATLLLASLFVALLLFIAIILDKHAAATTIWTSLPGSGSPVWLLPPYFALSAQRKIWGVWALDKYYSHVPNFSLTEELQRIKSEKLVT